MPCTCLVITKYLAVNSVICIVLLHISTILTWDSSCSGIYTEHHLENLLSCAILRDFLDYQPALPFFIGWGTVDSPGWAVGLGTVLYRGLSHVSAPLYCKPDTSTTDLGSSLTSAPDRIAMVSSARLARTMTKPPHLLDSASSALQRAELQTESMWSGAEERPWHRSNYELKGWFLRPMISR